jgi:hypothetical protein
MSRDSAPLGGAGEYDPGTGVDGSAGESLAVGCVLVQNRPNPFSASTLISYVSVRPGEVRLAIYNVLGREVVTLVDRHRSAGHYTVSWDGVDAGGQQCATGMYFCSFQTGGRDTIRKLVSVR